MTYTEEDRANIEWYKDQVANNVELLDVDEDTTKAEAESKFNEVYAAVCSLADALRIKL